ncbi:MAG TPA: DEAD/DEAH box helicase [Clostridium sp.]|nr:DEAD/DEAH box helicase [Clostridium sp.]
MFTNTKEDGLEDIIVEYLVENNGYELGNTKDYNLDFAVDEGRLIRFLESTQPEQVELLGIRESEHRKKQFFDRLSKEITKRGIIDVLRNGIKVYPADLIMFYLTPSDMNLESQQNFNKNIFSVTRQLQYSKSNRRLALDLAIFINGLPVITMELKNTLTNQNYKDAIYQYKNDRDPRDPLFQFKRCMAHFAVDDNEVYFCTKLSGDSSWFLPFNKGFQNGGGNPPNPNGIKTDYLWKVILEKEELTNIIENYAQLVVEKDEETKKRKEKQIFPRYHQWDVVKKLLADVYKNGVGKKYLIQHSAGSGKSNSIAWTAHQLVALEKEGKNLVDSVIIVTDRVILDKQIRDTIKQFMQVSSTVGHAESSGDLARLIKEEKKIIITTVHKFSFILDEIGTSHRNNKFAILIDEAHSSQSGSLSANMNIALSGIDEEETTEDKIIRIMEGRKMLDNASYFAFTATPKNKTLEMFGEEVLKNGEVKHEPFHNYSMKQAIEEGFILDVLQNDTTIKSYYKLAKIVEDDPMYDTKKAQRKLRNYVESNEYAIGQKADIMVNHFHEQVINKGKINGQARAMVVTSSIERAIEYYYAIERALAERKSQYKAIVAFSGEKEFKGQKLTEAKVNGFPSSQIEKKIKNDPYRFLVVADKFQTGYDEPLLHTMYVDKPLSGIKAVQTLSRLNRSHPGKVDTFILDFVNDVDIIEESFKTYYTTTILSEETDPNKLYDIQSELEFHQVYADYQVNEVVEKYINGASREKLDYILDTCAKEYKELEEDEQIDFKGNAKAFVRTYGFLASILPIGNIEWEKLNIFLRLLIPKLPSPKGEDLSKGILESIDLDSYRVQAQKSLSIVLEDEGDYEIDPVPTSGKAYIDNPELDYLSNILDSFHDMFGDIDWKDEDQVKDHISKIPKAVARDKAYQNAMKNSDKQNAKLESERALGRVIMNMMTDNIEIFKQYQDNDSFKKWLSDLVFDATYNTEGKEFNSDLRI